jgi:hypothetical protein
MADNWVLPSRRNGLWRFLATALLLVAPAASAEFSFVYDPGPRQWTLGNGLVEAVFQLTPGGYFQFRRFKLLRNGDTWAAPENGPVSPIQLQVGSSYFDANTVFSLISQSAQEIPREGYRETIVLEDAEGLGRIRVELEMYANQPVLRSSISFQNKQAVPVIVTNADMLPLLLADAGQTYQSFRVNQFAGGGVVANFEFFAETLSRDNLVVIDSGAYATQCAWLALRDQNNRGLFAGWEFDGRAWTTVQHAPDEGLLRLSSVIESLNRPLNPGEEFAVPPAFIGAFHGDWDEAGYRTQRFVEAAIAMPAPESRFPYVAWDSWGYGEEVDEETLRNNARIAASIGIELFVIDLGWARQLGDWQSDPGKFPSGLRSLSDFVHSLGMKFGLHFALLEASPDSPVLLENPDWPSSVDNNYLGLGTSLCASHRPVREWLVKEALRIIDEYNVDWMLQDGENMVKQCTKTTHTHDPFDSNYSNSVDGLNYVVDEVLRQRPGAIWENCEDGGNMMTFSMARRYATSITADNADVMTTRQAMFGATYPFPPRYTDRYMEDSSLDTYTTRSYMFGGPWIFMNRLASMSSRDLSFAASEISIYKTLREKIRDGKVFHLTPRPAEGRVDAIESYHAASDSAVVFVYRAGSAAASGTLKVRGLNANRIYTVRFQNTGQTYQASGSQLSSAGMRVNLREHYSAEIVYVDPVRGNPQ